MQIEESEDFGKLWAEAEAATAEANGDDGESGELESDAGADGESEGEPQSDEPNAGEDSENGDDDSDSDGELDESDDEEDSEDGQDGEDLTNFKALAKKLGYEIPESNVREVTSAERANWRRQMQEKRRNFHSEQRQLTDEFNSRVAQAKDELKDAIAVKEAMERRDHEALAKALGHKSWREVNEEFIKKTSDPAYLEVLRLRKETDAAKEREQKLLEQRKQQEFEAKKAEYYENHRKEIAVVLSDSDNKLFKALANDKAFVQDVLRYQEKSWDGHETIDIEEAAELAFQDAKLVFDELNKVFGSSPSGGANSEKPSAGEAGKKNGRKKLPKNIPQRSTSEARSVDGGEMSIQDWSTSMASLFSKG